MKIHAISTGVVKVTESWRVGRGTGTRRLLNALRDPNFTEWLPIYCFVIEHPDGLIVVDTGAPANANAPIYFPPWMRLVQHAAQFQITPDQEIGPQMRARGLEPKEVRMVVQTHLHQDHDGGLFYFPNAKVVIARAEWQAAIGLHGRLAGYLNYRWQSWLKPTLIDFAETGQRVFPKRHTLTPRGEIQLIPTPGHSIGHLAVLVQEDNHIVLIAGDASYTQALLCADAIDGIGPNPAQQQASHRAILELAAETPTVYLPTHEWDSARRLEQREPIPAQPIST